MGSIRQTFLIRTLDYHKTRKSWTPMPQELRKNSPTLTAGHRQWSVPFPENRFGRLLTQMPHI